MMSNYAEIREMWQRYIKKLCKPNNFQSLSNSGLSDCGSDNKEETKV